MAIDYKALIQIIAKDDTGTAFGRVQSSLDKNRNMANSMALGLTAFVASAAAAATAAYMIFDKFVSKAADFQDMGEKTGDTAAHMASLAVAANVADTSMESVVSMSAKLSKNLVGVDDDSTAAGAAIKALGLNINDLKNQSAADRLVTIGKAMAGFSRSANDAATVQALLGKGAAEALPFLLELANGVGQVSIMTDEAAKAADDFKDRQKALSAELSLTGALVSTVMVPYFTAFMESLKDTATEITGVGSASDALAKSNDLKEWAKITVQALAIIAEAAYATGQVLRSIGMIAAAGVGQTKALLEGDLALMKGIGDAWWESQRRMTYSLGLYDRLQTKLDQVDGKARSVAANLPPGAGDGRLPAWEDPRTAGFTQKPKPKGPIQFNGAKTGGAGGTGSAESMQKALEAQEIQRIKIQADELNNIYQNSEKIMEAMHAAGLLDDQTYYLSKRSFLNLETEAEDRNLAAQIKSLEGTKAKGADKIKNETKIAELQSKRIEIAGNLATQVEILGIKETESNVKVTQSYAAAEAAAQDYLDTLRRAQSSELKGMGAGNEERSRMSGRAQIEDKYSAQRQQLDLAKRTAELALKPGESISPQAQKTYDEEVDRIRRFKEQALADWSDYYAQLKQKQGDWKTGAAEAINNYAAEARDVSKQTEHLFTNAFQGMEDALVTFVTTGKLNFQSLADSIVADITRMIIKQQIMNALGIAGSGSSSGSGLMSLLSMAASAYSGTPSTAAAAAGSGSIYSLNYGSTPKVGLHLASGGSAPANRLMEVNELGPELLTIGGRQYLMMGSQAGTVTPNNQISSGSSNSVVNHFNVNVSAPAGTSRTSAQQWGAAAGRQIQHAVARNS